MSATEQWVVEDYDYEWRSDDGGKLGWEPVPKSDFPDPVDRNGQVVSFGVNLFRRPRGWQMKFSRYAIKHRLKDLRQAVAVEGHFSYSDLHEAYRRYQEHQSEKRRGAPIGRTEEMAAEMLWLENRLRNIRLIKLAGVMAKREAT